MNIFKTIGTCSYLIFTICVGDFTYIYVTKGINGDPFMGICFFSISCIFSFLLYRVGIWLYIDILKSIQTKTQSNRNKEAIAESNSISTDDMTENNLALDVESINIDGPEDENNEAEAAEDAANRETIIDELKEYTRTKIAIHFPSNDLPALLRLVDDFAAGNIACSPVLRKLSEVESLKPKDFYHYAWNLWVRLKPMNRRAMCRFIKNAFPNILMDSTEKTIYCKMTDNCYIGIIQNIPIEENLLNN